MSMCGFHDPGLIALANHFGVALGRFGAMPECDATRFEMIFVHLIVHFDFAWTRHGRHIFIGDRCRFHDR